MYHTERGPREEVYISYAGPDKLWADWIIWQLKAADIVAKTPKNDVPEILRQRRRILVILSRDYLNTLDTQPDWALLLQKEAQKTHGLILPVHARECRNEIRQILGPIHYLDLVGKNEADARSILLKFLSDAQEEIDQPTAAPPALDILKETTQRRELQERLRAFKQHESVSEQPDNLPTSLNHLPFQRNSLFTDRQEIIEHLERAFWGNPASIFSQPVALCGLGGIGKTQIALEYAHLHQRQYRQVFWAVATTRASLVSSFVALAKLLELPERNQDNQDEIVLAVKDWLQMNSEWLLILDDVANIKVARDFMPASGRGHILLTTQVQPLGTIAQSIPVGTLNTRTAATFLLRRIHAITEDRDFDTASDETRSQAKEIARQMDGLPLALDQAGAYIEEMHWDLSAYKEYYAQHLIELLGKRQDSSFYHTDSVITTWAISFKSLAKAHPTASQLLCFCAFLVIDQIPEEIITSAGEMPEPVLAEVGRNPFTFDSAIDELRKFSLISRNPSTRTLHVHGLVQAVIRKALQEKMQDVVPGTDEPYTWAKRVIQAVNHVFPRAAYENWERCERYIASAIACADLIEQWRTDMPEMAEKLEFAEAARLLHEAGTYLFDRTQYSQAERLYNIALEIRKKLAIPDELATSLNDLGWLHRALSQYDEARPLFDQALKIREHGSQHAFAETLNDLAWLNYNEGRYFDAEALNQRAFEIREAVQGDDTGLAASLNNLAWIHYVLGKYSAAEGEYTRALALQRPLEPEHPFTATMIDNLARLYRKLDRYGEAEQLFKEALEMRRRTEGENHPDLAHSLNGLGFLYFRLGKFELAEGYYEHSLYIHRRTWQSAHPHVAQILTNLARLAYAQGDYGQAKELYEQALDIRLQRHELDHPDTAHILSCFARLYRRLADYDQAEQLYQRSLAIREKVFRGLQHPDIAQVKNDMAGLRLAQGRYKESEELYEQALAIRKEILGERHLDVAQTLTNQVRLYRILGRYDEAEQCAQRAYNMWKQILGLEHHYIATILNYLGEVYQAREQYLEAGTVYQEALELQERTLRPDHPEVASTLNNLAAISARRGDYHQAQKYLERAIKIYTQMLGPEHLYLANSLEIRASIYRLQHKFAEESTFLHQVVALREKKLGPNHLAVTTVQKRLREIAGTQDK